MSTKFTYYIESVQVYPVGEWTISYEQNPGQIFKRKKFDGDLTFGGDDYNYIRSFTECEEVTFEIFCNEKLIFTGKFKTPYSFSFDEDSCFCVGKPDIYDEYSCIMDYYDKEFNFDDLSWNGALPSPGTVTITTCPGLVPITNYDDPIPIFYFFDAWFRTIGCDLDIRSSFFNEDDFPNGDSYAADPGVGINYVTGDTNRLTRIMLLRNLRVKEDIDPAATCNDNEIVVSWKFLESVFRDRFNAYWYIDQNGDFRIEHISFFLPGFAHSDYEPEIDLTAILRSDRKTVAYRTNKYEYVTDELYDQERWTWQYYYDTEGGVTHGADFQGMPIYYGANVNEKYDCVPGEFKEKEIATPFLWSDVLWSSGLADHTVIMCKGYALLCTNWDGNDLSGCATICEVGILSAASQPNGHCSTANLMHHYFSWDRIFLTGHMNYGGTPETTIFDSEIPKKLQVEIEIPFCCIDEFDPMRYIRTELGDGKLQSAVFNQNSLTVKLLI